MPLIIPYDFQSIGPDLVEPGAVDKQRQIGFSPGQPHVKLSPGLIVIDGESVQHHIDIVKFTALCLVNRGNKNGLYAASIKIFLLRFLDESQKIRQVDAVRIRCFKILDQIRADFQIEAPGIFLD